MASNTQATTNKRAWTHSRAGRKRKNAEARNSTLTYADLFAGCGEPGKPVGAAHAAAKPAAAKPAAAKPAAAKPAAAEKPTAPKAAKPAPKS